MNFQKVTAVGQRGTSEQVDEAGQDTFRGSAVDFGVGAVEVAARALEAVRLGLQQKALMPAPVEGQGRGQAGFYTRRPK